MIAHIFHKFITKYNRETDVSGCFKVGELSNKQEIAFGKSILEKGFGCRGAEAWRTTYPYFGECLPLYLGHEQFIEVVFCKSNFGRFL